MLVSETAPHTRVHGSAVRGVSETEGNHAAWAVDLRPDAIGRAAALPRTGLVIGLVASAAGTGGAVTISATQGSTALTLAVFGAMQLPTMFALICRWRVVWQYGNLYDHVVRLAAKNPRNGDLRELLLAMASTHPDVVGERLPGAPAQRTTPGTSAARDGPPFSADAETDSPPPRDSP